MLFMMRQVLKAGLCTEPRPQPDAAWRVEAERIQADLLTLAALSVVVFLVIVMVSFIRGLDASLIVSGDPAANRRARAYCAAASRCAPTAAARRAAAGARRSTAGPSSAPSA